LDINFRLGRGLLDSVPSGVIITEINVLPIAQKLGTEIIEVPSGEKAKTRQVKQQVEDELLEKGYGRDTVIIAVGGGALLDLAGFVASTYMRGVDLILVPTTLLAMVDAAIGGKTGIDTPHGKNLIGTIYHPKMIIADLDILDTLPEKEFQNGFSEIYKMGLIANPSILEETDLEDLILKTAQAKIKIVQLDPNEKGLRRILNFGHTIGHALEACSGYTLPHGEAVAMGCVTESYLSFLMGHLSNEDYQKIESKFPRFKLPKNYNRTSLIHALNFDKKKEKDRVRFVMIDRIGNPLSFSGQYCESVQDDILGFALTKMEQLYG
jgi:3-dehydroquinate synthase